MVNKQILPLVYSWYFKLLGLQTRLSQMFCNILLARGTIWQFWILMPKVTYCIELRDANSPDTLRGLFNTSVFLVEEQ